jgi:hypothetical protein
VTTLCQDMGRSACQWQLAQPLLPSSCLATATCTKLPAWSTQLNYWVDSHFGEAFFNSCKVGWKQGLGGSYSTCAQQDHTLDTYHACCLM